MFLFVSTPGILCSFIVFIYLFSLIYTFCIDVQCILMDILQFFCLLKKEMEGTKSDAKIRNTDYCNNILNKSLMKTFKKRNWEQIF